MLVLSTISGEILLDMVILKRIKFFFALLLIPAFLSTSCTRKRAPLGSEKNPVKFMFLPSVDAKLIASKTNLVEKFLEQNTPYKYKFAVPSSYVAVVEAFGTKRVDVAVINTFGYVMAHDKYGVNAKMTLIRHGAHEYNAQIVARADSDIKKLEDLKDKKFAYVDPSSTSGYLLPAKLFKDKKINLKETVFARKHDNVITMVYQKQVDGGATFYSPPLDGKIQDARRLVKTQYPNVEDEIKIIELTSYIPNDPVVFRSGMPEDMKNSIVDALLKYVKTEEGKSVFMDLYGGDDFIKSDDSKYDPVRSMLKELGASASDLVKKS